MAKEMYLPDSQIFRLLDIIEEQYDTVIFTPAAVLRYRNMNEEDKRRLALREPRSPFPAKSFFLPAKERIAEYGVQVKSGQVNRSDAGSQKPPALINLRSCDLEAVAVLDQIFLQGDFVDPYYKKRSDSILVVSVDCVSITEFCFCHVLGYQPFVQKGLGINLSPVEGGFVVRSDTAAGEKIVERLGLSSPADPARKEEVGRSHQETLRLLKESNEKFSTSQSYHDILKKNPPSEKWSDLFNTCVECAACTNICPTCYCFYMFDQARYPDRRDTFERLRSWDSCLLADYSRMAGVGGMKPTPRPYIRDRYANRFNHKYLHHYDTYGRYGCTGCGRCTQGCMGTTDPREVMRVLGQ